MSEPKFIKVRESGLEISFIPLPPIDDVLPSSKESDSLPKFRVEKIFQKRKKK